jgi:hypothetical protein
MHMPDYDLRQVDGIEDLVSRMKAAESVTDWSYILSDYISFGNTKISKSVAIFNMNSATDCPNIGTDNCQVPKSKCYAYKAENVYKQPLPYRRRQEYLWDCLDADTWARAFLELVGRKRNTVTAIRFSEAGDFRHRGDIIKVNRIAQIVDKADIDVYTYSASDYLNWDYAENFTVNASNDLSEYGDRRYMAFEGDEKPDGYVWCPHDLQKREEGITGEEAIQCGDCRLCIDDNGPDVAIPLHD